MTRADKTLEAMRANPRDWRIGSLEAVAAAFGVNVRSRVAVMSCSSIRDGGGAFGSGAPADQTGVHPPLRGADRCGEGQRRMSDYRFTVRPLSDDEGGGYLVEFPDLPGCMSDGETIEEAVASGQDAKASWIAAMTEAGHPIPPPTVEPPEPYSGKWQLRAPKSLHRKLTERARREGVSLNTLAVALIAEGLGAKEAPPPSPLGEKSRG
jgi:antitoxin HicB